MPLESILKQVGQDLLNLVFPPICVVCRAEGTLLCEACVGRLPRLTPPLCERCGSPTGGAGECGCRRTKLTIDGIRSVLLLENGAREAVHQLKYGGRSSLAAPLAQLMTDYWSISPLPADVWVAVPLHVARERERGYNQAYLLARECARMVGLPPMSGKLKRVRNTAAQVGLGASERHENVWGAFQYQAPGLGDGVRGQQVLLVDDVCTTGATLDACSAALKTAGAASVWGFTLARAA